MVKSSIDYYIKHIPETKRLTGEAFDKAYWKAYLAEDHEAVNSLVICHWAIAMDQARQMAAQYNMSERLDDIFSDAIVGLLHAGKRYHLEAEKPRPRSWAEVAFSWTRKYAQTACKRIYKHACVLDDDSDVRERANSEITPEQELLQDVLSRLSPDERGILCHLYGVGGEKLTMRQVAMRYNMSVERLRERVKQIKAKAAA